LDATAIIDDLIEVRGSERKANIVCFDERIKRSAISDIKSHGSGASYIDLLVAQINKRRDIRKRCLCHLSFLKYCCCVNPAGRHIKRGISSTHQTRFDHELCQRDDRVTTHRAVAFIVKKEDIEIGISRTSDHRAIHVSMAARFPHQASANVIVMFTEVPTLFEYVLSLEAWQAINDDTQRLTARVHVDGGDPGPMFRKLPVERLHVSLRTKPQIFTDAHRSENC